MTKRESFTITLRDEQPARGTAEIRLRRWLKCTLRSFGFRCTRIRGGKAKR